MTQVLENHVWLDYPIVVELTFDDDFGGYEGLTALIKQLHGRVDQYDVVVRKTTDGRDWPVAKFFFNTLQAFTEFTALVSQGW